MKTKTLLESDVGRRIKDIDAHSELAFAAYMKAREKPDKEYIPSKETCVRYTLSICGRDPNEAEEIIAHMIEANKNLSDFVARQRWDEFTKPMGAKK